ESAAACNSAAGRARAAVRVLLGARVPADAHDVRPAWPTLQVHLLPWCLGQAGAVRPRDGSARAAQSHRRACVCAARDRHARGTVRSPGGNRRHDDPAQAGHAMAGRGASYSVDGIPGTYAVRDPTDVALTGEGT